jgi:5-methylcytosine-specific restriction endonuclease McrA
MANMWKGKYMGVRCRADLRLAIYMRDDFTCLHCGRDLHDASPLDINLDHFIPHSHGGTNDPTNLFTSCQWCNKGRQDKTIDQLHASRPEVIVRIVTHLAKSLNRKLAKSLVDQRKQTKESK